MTTQEKTAALQRILANHQDNQAAVAAVNVHPGLDSFVVQAMNEAFKSDLVAVFELKATQNVPLRPRD